MTDYVHYISGIGAMVGVVGLAAVGSFFMAIFFLAFMALIMMYGQEQNHKRLKRLESRDV